MAQRYELGRLAGLRLTAGPSAIVGSAALWVLLSSVAVLALGISLGTAVVGGLAPCCSIGPQTSYINSATPGLHARLATR